MQKGIPTGNGVIINISSVSLITGLSDSLFFSNNNNNNKNCVAKYMMAMIFLHVKGRFVQTHKRDGNTYSHMDKTETTEYYERINIQSRMHTNDRLGSGVREGS